MYYLLQMFNPQVWIMVAIAVFITNVSLQLLIKSDKSLPREGIQLRSRNRVFYVMEIISSKGTVV